MQIYLNGTLIHWYACELCTVNPLHTTPPHAASHQQRPSPQHTHRHVHSPTLRAPMALCFSINIKWLSVTLADKAETKMTYMPWMEELKPNIITRLCIGRNRRLSLRLTFWFPTFLAQPERGRDRWRLISLLSKEILKPLFKGFPHTFNLQNKHACTHWVLILYLLVKGCVWV